MAQHLSQLGFLSTASQADEDLIWAIGRFIQHVPPDEAFIVRCAVLDRIHEAGLFASRFFGPLLLNCGSKLICNSLWILAFALASRPGIDRRRVLILRGRNRSIGCHGLRNRAAAAVVIV